MTELTSFEKEQELERHNKRQEKIYKRGKSIVLIIVFLQIVTAVLSMITNSSVLGLIVNLALAAALFFGVSWVRYLLAVANTISIFTGLYTLLVAIDYSTVQDISTVYIIIAGGVIGILISIFISCMLFFSKSVSEFLYHQKHM